MFSSIFLKLKLQMNEFFSLIFKKDTLLLILFCSGIDEIIILLVFGVDFLEDEERIE